MSRYPLLAVALLGCTSGADSVATFTVSTDTVDGVVHVTNAGAPPQWTTRRIFSVGSAEGDVQFGRIMSIAADADGFVYVADRVASQVLAFDSTGAPVASFGRPGEGPGEFRALYSVALLGDTVVTLDPGAARLGLFDKRGRWLGSWRHQPLTGSVRLEGAAEDEVYNPIVVPRDGGTVDRAYVQLTHAGPSDTLVLPERDERAAESVLTCFGADGGIHTHANPFAGRELIRAAPGGRLLWVWTADYRLALLSGGLDTLRVVERLRQPITLDDEAWDTALAEFDAWLDGIPSPQCEGRREPERPAAYPAAREVILDPTGRIWVETYAAAGLAFDVFDLRGRLLGTVPAPERDEGVRPYVRGDRFYVVTADELGVQRVEAYGVIP